MQTVRTMRQARTRVTPRSAQATSGDPLTGKSELTRLHGLHQVCALITNIGLDVLRTTTNIPRLPKVGHLTLLTETPIWGIVRSEFR
jgi:hypothetical protein